MMSPILNAPFWLSFLYPHSNHICVWCGAQVEGGGPLSSCSTSEFAPFCYVLSLFCFASIKCLRRFCSALVSSFCCAYFRLLYFFSALLRPAAAPPICSTAALLYCWHLLAAYFCCFYFCCFCFCYTNPLPNVSAYLHNSCLSTTNTFLTLTLFGIVKAHALWYGKRKKVFQNIQK